MQTSNDRPGEQVVATSRVTWSTSDLLVGAVALMAVVAIGWYAVQHGVRPGELGVTFLFSSVFAMGAYDTRHNQPTLYNLLRSWPFGSAAEDERRGKRTVSSQALHGLFCLSICLCLLLIALKRP
jgi:hypothetical protein